MSSLVTTDKQITELGSIVDRIDIQERFLKLAQILANDSSLALQYSNEILVTTDRQPAELSNFMKLLEVNMPVFADFNNHSRVSFYDANSERQWSLSISKFAFIVIEIELAL